MNDNKRSTKLQHSKDAEPSPMRLGQKERCYPVMHYEDCCAAVCADSVTQNGMSFSLCSLSYFNPRQESITFPQGLCRENILDFLSQDLLAVFNL